MLRLGRKTLYDYAYRIMMLYGVVAILVLIGKMHDYHVQVGSTPVIVDTGVVVPNNNAQVNDKTWKKNDENILNNNNENNNNHVVIIKEEKIENIPIIDSQETDRLTAQFMETIDPNGDWKSTAQEFSGWTKFPFSMDDFKRSFTYGLSTHCHITNLKNRLNNNETIRIGVYGGSVTLGILCFSKTLGDELNCCWFARLKAWFKKTYPQWNITFVNHAKFGFGSNYFAEKPELFENVDLMLLSTVPNDWPLMDNNNLNISLTTIYKMTKNTALLFLETRTCCDKLTDCEVQCGKNQLPHNRYIQTARDNRPRPERVISECLPGTSGSAFYTCPIFWDTAEMELNMAKERQMAVSSYRDAIWPVRDKPPADMKYFWTGGAHPDAVGHDLMFYVISYALFRLIEMTPPPRHRCEKKQEQFELLPCQVPLVDYDAMNPKSLQPQVAENWVLREDRRAKPGWISNSDAGKDAKLVFKLKAREDAKMQITFLKSYEGFGKASVTVEGCDEDIVLDSYWKTRVSVGVMQKFARNPQEGFVTLPCLPNHGREFTVTFRTKEKFKLLRIVSC